MGDVFSQLKRDDRGLVTVVVQDRHTGLVRMVAHANDEALRATLSTRLGHFYSRSRQRLWKKGEESGHVLHVHEVWVDCDADCILYLVDPDGPSCHTGQECCFYQRIQEDGSVEVSPHAQAAPTLSRLFRELEARCDQPADKSYTKSLLERGAPKIAAKIREEGEELAAALETESNARVTSEAGDVIYHLLVGLLLRGLTLRDVQAELARRFGMSGLAEKARRSAPGG